MQADAFSALLDWCAGAHATVFAMSDLIAGYRTCDFVMSAAVVLAAQMLMIASKLAKCWLTMHDFVNSCKPVIVKIISNIIKEPLAFLDCYEKGWLVDDLLSTLNLF